MNKQTDTLETDLIRAKTMAGKWNITGDDGFLAIIEKFEHERNALRAEVEKLKADKARLEYILIGTGITREIIDNRMNGGVR